MGRGRTPLPVVPFTHDVPDTEIAWAAGFFDGEGCIGIYGYALRIDLTQARIEPLERFRLAVCDQSTKVRAYPQRRHNGKLHYSLAIWRLAVVLHAMDRMW